MGKLIIVGLPIGNLRDISLRALDALKTTQVIICEDTRRIGGLLGLLHQKQSELGIDFDLTERPRLVSYREQNHRQIFEQIMELLATQDCLLTTDSGMPLISDPGFKLVTELMTAGFEIDVVPGPTAITTALAIGGVPPDKFSFVGFLPRKPGEIKRLLEEYKELPTTIVLYESPFRVEKTLKLIHEALGNRVVSVCRELTKLHQEVMHGPVAELLQKKLTLKGEFVILIAKKDYSFT